MTFLIKVATTAVAVSMCCSAAIAGPQCLRSDRIAHLVMTSDKAATATDTGGRHFTVLFSHVCSARHINVHFVLQPEDMKPCLSAGVELQTNREGTCLVKSVERAG